MASASNLFGPLFLSQFLKLNFRVFFVYTTSSTRLHGNDAVYGSLNGSKVIETVDRNMFMLVQ